MAVRNGFDEQGNHCGFSSTLSSAALEWLLMVLLFLDALFSYLVTKFARISKLQVPCLICSRLDHVFSKEDPGFYKDLICRAHKLEISSLSYCHTHHRLADFHEMCDGCLLPFATENKPNTETYQLLVGSLGSDVTENKVSTVVDEEDVMKVPLLVKDVVTEHSSKGHCSCCSKLFEKETNASRLLQSKHIGTGICKGEGILPSFMGEIPTHLHDIPISMRGRSPKIHTFDQLAHVGYNKLNVTSDSESEAPLSDDDSHLISCSTQDIREGSARSFEPGPAIPCPTCSPKTLLVGTISDKPVDPDPVILEQSLSAPKKSLGLDEFHNSRNMADMVARGHGFEEVNLNQVEGETNLAVPHGSFDFTFQPVPSEISSATLDASDLSQGIHVSVESVNLTRDKGSTEITMKKKQVASWSTPTLQGSLDLNDAYSLAVGTKGSQTPPSIGEMVTGRDSSKIHEDLRILLSQISAARGFDFPLSEMSPSPRIQCQLDEFKLSDASSSAVLQNITKRLSLDRNESGLESLDGSIVSEIEGETPLDRLKRQIELDRRSINLIYKELEEERNASAIAASQAMAMINRLQEEKAAVQMEALQYQRMMEEQAEYDQEALQNINVHLNRREKEIQDLEAELGNYKTRYGRDSHSENKPERVGNVEVEEINHVKSDKNMTSQREHGWDPSVGLEGRLLHSEDEKSYMAECLRKLEKKLQHFSSTGVYVDMPRFHAEKGALSHKIVTAVDSEQEHAYTIDRLTSNGMHSEETELPYLNDIPQPPSTASHAKSSSNCLGWDAKEQNNETLCMATEDNRSVGNKGQSLSSLKDEILMLNERLEMLEADRDFLEHAINSLRKGSDGVQFIEEIACYLRDLRRIGVPREHAKR